MDKAVKISIIAGALIVSLSIAYYLVIFLPQKEQNRIELEKQERQIKEEREQAESERLNKIKTANNRLLAICLSAADEEYLDYAKLNGTEKKDGTIWADNDVWDRAEKNRKDSKEVYFKKYPQ